MMEVITTAAAIFAVFMAIGVGLVVTSHAVLRREREVSRRSLVHVYEKAMAARQPDIARAILAELKRRSL